MTRHIVQVISTTTPDSGQVLAARLGHLVGLGWDVRLFAKGEEWERDLGLTDPALSERVEFVTAKKYFEPPSSLLRRPVELEVYRRSPGEPGPFDGRLLDLRPDLIHYHSGWNAWRGLRLQRLLDSRIIVSFREDGQDLAVPDADLLWAWADLLLFPSTAALERAVAQGAPRDKAEILHAPVMDADPAEGQHPEPGLINILSAGPMVWEQGYEHSVHAVRLLLDEGVGCRYRILGEGDHLAAVAFARHQLGVADHVDLVATDGRDRLVEEIAAADVFVDPAVTDTTSPSALLAAQARGVPFVATRRRSPLAPDAGIAVPRRNPRAIAEALLILAADPELRRRMGRAARTAVSGELTLEDHLAQLESLYERTLARHR